MPIILSDADKFVDEPTRKMLEALIKRKQKFEQFKKHVLRWRIVCFVCFFIFCITLYLKSGQSGSILYYLFSDSTSIFWILAIAFSYSASFFFHKKEDKAENEYHKLRCEIIQKSPDLWPLPQKWETRETVYRIMKESYDINLYFESK
ncbi:MULTISPECIES: YpbF family protein [Bacillus]|uniref:DUF2663 domain-containing protein n=2 Tax=Bacillus TaxID=1386 RepID=A0A0M3R9H4_9BACI|nr:MULTISPECIES: YpbF family protein [Bacillus]ALC81442.1 hypothetical protein AM592_07400 [Bacillus gobiensis]MBP1080478.1 hypothetical protein [Bacillus capparidis]MED1094335.1 YpbF family protein [Bacillus capparidis]